jgi:hypothetical protein
MYPMFRQPAEGERTIRILAVSLAGFVIPLAVFIVGDDP